MTKVTKNKEWRAWPCEECKSRGKHRWVMGGRKGMHTHYSKHHKGKRFVLPDSVKHEAAVCDAPGGRGRGRCWFDYKHRGRHSWQHAVSHTGRKGRHRKAA